MRTLLSLLALVFITSATDEQPADTTVMMADAEQASITNPYTISIEDNYGNPEAFVKYMIRKPPALA